MAKGCAMKNHDNDPMMAITQMAGVKIVLSLLATMLKLFQ
jgi:hypothetical protein